MSDNIVVGSFEGRTHNVVHMLYVYTQKNIKIPILVKKTFLFQCDKTVLYVGGNSLNKIIVHSRRVADELE